MQRHRYEVPISGESQIAVVIDGIKSHFVDKITESRGGLVSGDLLIVTYAGLVDAISSYVRRAFIESDDYSLFYRHDFSITIQDNTGKRLVFKLNGGNPGR